MWKQRFLIVAAILAAVACVAFSQPADRKIDGTAKMRVGTFKRTELLVAYYRSSIHAKALRDLQSERDRAKAAGDEKRAKEIEDRGGAMQELAHKQLAGEAMLNNVLEHLRDGLSDVAKQTNVPVIVEEPLYYDKATVELVDVTDALVKRLPPAK